MERGTVKWFSEAKGYGFIGVDGNEGGKDLFVHYTGILKNGHDKRNLKEGQRVEFDITDGKKGPQAVNVQVI